MSPIWKRESSPTYHLLFATFGSFDVKLDTLSAIIATQNLGIELEFHALLLQNLLGGFGYLRVHPRSSNLAEEFDHCDIGT
jgi:hypothetical protein